MSIFRVKLIALSAFLLFLVVTCSKPGKQPYSIAASKTYEASLYRQNCAICHGPEAEGKTLSDGRPVPSLREGQFKYRTDAEIYRHISEGGNGMLPFRGLLTERELRMMVAFVQNDLRGNNR